MGTWATGDGIVEFPDGRRVRGRGIHRIPGGPEPEFGVYLLARDPNIRNWRSRWVRWRDFGLPVSTDEAVSALREAHTRAPVERVEVACAGGIGRTGTGLAVLAIMSGVAPSDAIDWIRQRYHPQAVETRRQRRWISEVAALVGG